MTDISDTDKNASTHSLKREIAELRKEEQLIEKQSQEIQVKSHSHSHFH